MQGLTRFWRGGALASLGIAGLMACSDNNGSTPSPGPGQSVSPQLSQWTAAQIASIRLDASNTIPNTGGQGREVMPGFHNWDYMPVETRDGQQALINGYRMYMVLSAPRAVTSGKRHDIARIRYIVSRDGETWMDMGEIFPEAQSVGSRQWAGSAVWDPATQQIYVYYSGVGIKGERIDTSGAAGGGSGTRGTPGGGSGQGGGSGSGGGGSGTGGGNGISYDQVIVLATARVSPDTSNGLRFEGWQHRRLLEGDGTLYQKATGTDASGTVLAFRDPHIFRDPTTGTTYMLFMGRLPGAEQTWNGAVGIARLNGNDLGGNWELLPALLSSTGVNNELERPHIRYQNGRYYLYVSTHREKFNPDGPTGPEGLYGWTAQSLNGPWTPLNGSGLVAANPPEDPYMHYSWLVLPDNTTIGNVNYYGVGPSLEISEFPAQGEAWDRAHWGGILAPRLVLEVRGDRTRILSTQPAYLQASPLAGR